jgi:hypothetical protein
MHWQQVLLIVAFVAAWVYCMLRGISSLVRFLLRCVRVCRSRRAVVRPEESEEEWARRQW